MRCQHRVLYSVAARPIVCAACERSIPRFSIVAACAPCHLVLCAACAGVDSASMAATLARQVIRRQYAPLGAN